MPLFLKWWDETGAAQSISLPRNRNAITVITIHKAKGLQYKAVVLPDCDWSLQPKTGSLIWGRTDEKPFDSLKHMPLGWSKLIGESAFAEEFYTETVFSHIDNINLFYVAATRAEQELHIQIPRGGKETQRIGSLVMSAIQCADDGSAAIGETRGSVVQDDAGRFFRFGTPERPLHTEHREPEPVASYPTRRIGARLRIRLDSQRYFEDGDAHAPLSPRNYGILMHKLLENAADKPRSTGSSKPCWPKEPYRETKREKSGNCCPRPFPIRSSHRGSTADGASCATNTTSSSRASDRPAGPTAC